VGALLRSPLFNIPPFAPPKPNHLNVPYGHICPLCYHSCTLFFYHYKVTCLYCVHSLLQTRLDFLGGVTDKHGPIRHAPSSTSPSLFFIICCPLPRVAQCPILRPTPLQIQPALYCPTIARFELDQHPRVRILIHYTVVGNCRIISVPDADTSTYNTLAQC
jgi:hypothetical protein